MAHTLGPWVVHKVSRMPSSESYDGISWRKVAAIRQATYDDYDAALAAAKELSAVNPVGFIVSKAEEARDMAHTPGPWNVTNSHDWTGMEGVAFGIDDAAGMDGERDYHLATVVHGDPDELVANARLIAAAPDLLEALKGLVAWAEEYGGERPHRHCGCTYCVARAAIAKAEWTGGLDG